MSDRFDLEQEILRCWTITSDLKVFVEQNATPEAYSALAGVYDIYFDKLWNTFEQMIQDGKIK